jgi:hypothetical protein
MKNKAVRIGIAIDDNHVPQWMYRVIEKLCPSARSEIKLVIYCQYAQRDRTDVKRSMMYRLHCNLDRFAASKRIDFNTVSDVSEMINGVPSISVGFQLTADKSRMIGQLNEIARYNLDVIIDLSSNGFTGSGLKLARYGIWQYMIEDCRPTDVLQGIYWKVVRKTPVLEAALHCSDSPAEKKCIIHRSHIPTNFNSMHLNLDLAYGLCSMFVARLTENIHLFGANFLHDQKLQ